MSTTTYRGWTIHHNPRSAGTMAAYAAVRKTSYGSAALNHRTLPALFSAIDEWEKNQS